MTPMKWSPKSRTPGKVLAPGSAGLFKSPSPKKLGGEKHPGGLGAKRPVFGKGAGKKLARAKELY